MPGNRHRSLISSRRRTQDDGDDEDEVLDVDDDSISEDSIITGADADRANENIGAEDSEFEFSEVVDPRYSTSQQAPERTNDSSLKHQGPETLRDGESISRESPHSRSQQKALFIPTDDVEVMKNGLPGSDAVINENGVDFDDLTDQVADGSDTQGLSTGQGRDVANKRRELRQRRIRDAETYKAKRDSDPAFVPTRGGFFMHDQRHDSSYSGHPSQLPYGRGRGRGRGRGTAASGSGGVNRLNFQSNEVSKERWDHDLHETVADVLPPDHKTPIHFPARTKQAQTKENSSTQSLSKSIALGTVTIRILLPNMKTPIVFEKMPLRQHTRLPDLRPPLRRDKPVRISLPERPASYIFPTTERSFIFIPRAQRPNQAGNRAKGRGHFSQAGSRRTSAYAGSVYTPSISMSRRSSMARDGVISPTGSHISRVPGARTIVRLPSAHQYGGHGQVTPSQAVIISGSNTPIVSAPLGASYPLPSQPVHRQHRPSHIPMHQPRPQKAVSVATIESPNQIPLHTPQQQEQQPFHHQVPTHINGQQSQHVRQPSFQAQPTGSTPLSNIPEGAINAQPFQPTSLAMPAFYPAPYALPPSYYYAPPPPLPPPMPGISPEHFAGSMVSSPPFVPHGQYFIPMMMPAPAPAPVANSKSLQQQQQQPPPPATSTGMFAHESNGMVYYYNPSQLMGNVESLNAAAAASGYAIPSVEGMMTSAPDGYFYAQPPLPPPDMTFYPAQ